MKIICIGRNYADHAKELKNDIPTKPLFFVKPDSALLRNNQPFYYPDFSKNIHHEIEVVIKIDKLGKNIEQEFAHKYYSEFTLGIDFTARDLQDECKTKGLPWEIAKGFDGSAVIGKFMKMKDYDLNQLSFQLTKNDNLVQDGNTKDMIFSFDAIIAHVSKFMTLKIGDYIYTGTPKGVGEIKIGDMLRAKIGEKEIFKCEIR